MNIRKAMSKITSPRKLKHLRRLKIQSRKMTHLRNIMNTAKFRQAEAEVNKYMAEKEGKKSLGFKLGSFFGKVANKLKPKK